MGCCTVDESYVLVRGKFYTFKAYINALSEVAVRQLLERLPVEGAKPRDVIRAVLAMKSDRSRAEANENVAVYLSEKAEAVPMDVAARAGPPILTIP